MFSNDVLCNMCGADVKVEVKEAHKKEVDFKELSIEEAFELLKVWTF